MLRADLLFPEGSIGKRHIRRQAVVAERLMQHGQWECAEFFFLKKKTEVSSQEETEAKKKRTRHQWKNPVQNNNSKDRRYQTLRPIQLLTTAKKVLKSTLTTTFCREKGRLSAAIPLLLPPSVQATPSLVTQQQGPLL